MNATVKTLIFWVAVVVSAFLLWQVVKTNPDQRTAPEISYSSFLTQIANGQVSRVTIAGNVSVDMTPREALSA